MCLTVMSGQILFKYTHYYKNAIKVGTGSNGVRRVMVYFTVVIKHAALRLLLKPFGCRLFLKLGQVNHLSQQMAKE